MPDLTVAADAPFLVVLNAGSGHDDAEATRSVIEAVLSEAGRRHVVRLVDDPKHLARIAAETVSEARARGGVVVAAGGDGSINTIAHAALGSGCAFGVLPQGTFNYFSRAHGIPADTAEATRLLLTCRPQAVQVGRVNERIFLVNASLGLYPQMLEDREAWKGRFGRSRPVAMFSVLATLLRERRQLRLAVEHLGARVTLRTPTLFVGNNPLQFEQIGIPAGPALDQGQLVAVVLHPVGSAALLWLLLRGAFGSLGDADHVDHFAFRRIVIEPVARRRPRQVKVATDGEVVWLDAPVAFSVSEEPLYLLKPEPRAGDRSAPPPERSDLAEAPPS